MSKTTDIEVLRRWRLIGAVLSVALAVAAAVFMNAATYEITLSHLTKDALASRAGPVVLAPATHHVYDVSVRNALVVLLTLTAVYLIVLATRWRPQYDKNLDNGVQPQRWLGLGIIGGLMTELVALLAGVNDLMTLKLIGGAIVVACLLGWVTERLSKLAKRPAWSTFILAVFIGVCAWLAILGSALGTLVYGMARSPWYVYALIAVMGVASLLVMVNLLRGLTSKGQTRSYIGAERRYMIVGLVAKVAFAVILIIGLKR